MRDEGRGWKLKMLFEACGIAAAIVRRAVKLNNIVILRERKQKQEELWGFKNYRRGPNLVLITCWQSCGKGFPRGIGPLYKASLASGFLFVLVQERLPVSTCHKLIIGVVEFVDLIKSPVNEMIAVDQQHRLTHIARWTQARYSRVEVERHHWMKGSTKLDMDKSPPTQ